MRNPTHDRIKPQDSTSCLSIFFLQLKSMLVGNCGRLETVSGFFGGDWLLSALIPVHKGFISC